MSFGIMQFLSSLLTGLREIRGDMKHTWQLINNVIHDNFGHSKSSSVDELSWDSSVLTDPVNIANKFNEYFTHIGPNLAAKIPQEVWFSFGLRENQCKKEYIY